MERRNTVSENDLPQETKFSSGYFYLAKQDMHSLKVSPPRTAKGKIVTLQILPSPSDQGSITGHEVYEYRESLDTMC